MTWSRRIAVTVSALAALAMPASAAAFDAGLEAKNFAKILEREQHITLTPEFQARLQQQNVEGPLELLQINLDDPERLPGNICATYQQECAGDVRFYEWDDDGFGMVTPVVYTTRSGATISGRVWATAGGPAKRPGIVITTGSVQAPETLYWGYAATLAKRGYVVLTYDVQGQGRSDVFGEGVDSQEGVPSQEGQPFYDGTEEGLDFLLSTPTAPYEPRLSCGNANSGTGTSHAAKHDRRVDEGLNAKFNPFWELVDPERIGIAGHSLGAAAVSYIGQTDPRVDAIVAWDNLRAPTTGPECPSTPSSRPEDPPITKPALGMSNDYGLTQQPFTDDPDPQSKNAGFEAYKAAGVDSMQVNTRGGTHFEYSFLPGMTFPLPLGAATLRGNDMVAWYTAAWFDKHVRCPGEPNPTACEAAADAQLLSDRWRNDAPGLAVDQNADGNLFSFYLRSRFDFVDVGDTERVCDDMRAGCPAMAPDGAPVPYSFLSAAFGPDLPGGGGGPGPHPEPCTLPQRGSAGADTPATLPPTEAGDAIRGSGGNDRLRGLGGDDCLYGNAGRDRLGGDEGNDKLRGGPDDDKLVGGPGRDALGGGTGNDFINAVDGKRDRIVCGRGRRDRVQADGRDKIGRECDTVAVAQA